MEPLRLALGSCTDFNIVNFIIQLVQIEGQTQNTIHIFPRHENYIHSLFSSESEFVQVFTCICIAFEDPVIKS